MTSPERITRVMIGNQKIRRANRLYRRIIKLTEPSVSSCEDARELAHGGSDLALTPAVIPHRRALRILIASCLTVAATSAPIVAYAQTFDSSRITIETIEKPSLEQKMAESRQKVINLPGSSSKGDAAKTLDLKALYEKPIDFKTINSNAQDSKAQEAPKKPLLDTNELKKLMRQLEVSGGDVSGGGTTVPTTQGRRLLDVYHFSDSSGPAIQEEHLPSQKLLRLNLDQTAIREQLAQVMGRVRKVSPLLADLLSQVSQQFPIYLVQGRFQFLTLSFAMPAELEGTSIETLSTTALYIRDIGVLISRDELMEMSSFQQTALITHELVRMLQIQFQLQLTHLELQNVVASILDPQSDLELELRKTKLDSFLDHKAMSPQLAAAQRVEAELVQKYGSHFQIGLDELQQAQDQSEMALAIDLVSQLSLRIYIYRASNELSPSEARYLRDQELILDSSVSQLRRTSMGLVMSERFGQVTGLVATLHHSPAEKKLLRCVNSQVSPSSGCTNFKKLFKTLIR